MYLNAIYLNNNNHYKKLISLRAIEELNINSNFVKTNIDNNNNNNIKFKRLSTTTSSKINNNPTNYIVLIPGLNLSMVLETYSLKNTINKLLKEKKAKIVKYNIDKNSSLTDNWISIFLGTSKFVTGVTNNLNSHNAKNNLINRYDNLFKNILNSKKTFSIYSSTYFYNNFIVPVCPEAIKTYNTYNNKHTTNDFYTNSILNSFNDMSDINEEDIYNKIYYNNSNLEFDENTSSFIDENIFNNLKFNLSSDITKDNYIIQFPGLYYLINNLIYHKNNKINYLEGSINSKLLAIDNYINYLISKLKQNDNIFIISDYKFDDNIFLNIKNKNSSYLPFIRINNLNKYDSENIIENEYTLNDISATLSTILNINFNKQNTGVIIDEILDSSKLKLDYLKLNNQIKLLYIKLLNKLGYSDKEILNQFNSYNNKNRKINTVENLINDNNNNSDIIIKNENINSNDIKQDLLLFLNTSSNLIYKKQNEYSFKNQITALIISSIYLFFVILVFQQITFLNLFQIIPKIIEYISSLFKKSKIDKNKNTSLLQIKTLLLAIISQIIYITLLTTINLIFNRNLANVFCINLYSSSNNNDINYHVYIANFFLYSIIFPIITHYIITKLIFIFYFCARNINTNNKKVNFIYFNFFRSSQNNVFYESGLACIYLFRMNTIILNAFVLVFFVFIYSINNYLFNTNSLIFYFDNNKTFEIIILINLLSAIYVFMTICVFFSYPNFTPNKQIFDSIFLLYDNKVLDLSYINIKHTDELLALNSKFTTEIINFDNQNYLFYKSKNDLSQYINSNHDFINDDLNNALILNAIVNSNYKLNSSDFSIILDNDLMGKEENINDEINKLYTKFEK